MFLGHSVHFLENILAPILFIKFLSFLNMHVLVIHFYMHVMLNINIILRRLPYFSTL